MNRAPAVALARPTLYKIIFTERYTRIAARCLKRHPDMVRAYEKTLAPLQINPQHPTLRVNALGGRLQGVHNC